MYNDYRPYSDLSPAVENLIWVGGLEGLGLTRRELLWQVGLWMGPESDDKRRSGGREDHPQLDIPLSDPFASLPFPHLNETEKMVAEYRILRFSTDVHPISLLADQLAPDTVISERFPDLPQGATVQVAGIVVARQRPGTAKGYVFILMEDESGPINIIVKPDVYERDRGAVRMEPFLAVRGRLQKDGATLNVIAHEVHAIRVPGTPVRRQGLARSNGASEATPSPFRYLTALRQSPPGIKSFG